MRGHIAGLCVGILLLSVAGAANAVSFHDIAEESRWISTNGDGPADNGWFNLDLPSTWYDPTEVTVFDIILTGDDDNSRQAIDIFLSFDDDLSTYTRVASRRVRNNREFTLTLDIVNGDLLYNGRDRGDDVTGVSLEDFLGLTNFWVGYGCHFTHLSSEVYIEQNGATPTPEPGTMFLLGSGLIGLAGLRRKFQK